MAEPSGADYFEGYAAEIQPGTLLELNLWQGRREVGQIMTRVTATDVPNNEGMLLDVKGLEGSTEALGSWAVKALRPGGTRVHLCRHGRNFCARLRRDSAGLHAHACLHVEQWRVRDRYHLIEPWWASWRLPDPDDREDHEEGGDEPPEDVDSMLGLPAGDAGRASAGSAGRAATQAGRRPGGIGPAVERPLAGFGEAVGRQGHVRAAGPDHGCGGALLHCQLRPRHGAVADCLSR